MSSISLSNKTMGLKSLNASAMQSMALKAFLRSFSSIKHGQLIVNFSDETFKFGEAKPNEDLKAIVNVNDISAFQQMFVNGVVGAGESYMQGLWHSPDLVAVIRVVSKNLSVTESFNAKQSPFRKLSLKLLRFIDRNSLKGSRKNIAAHYDLGNDFFSLFLDPTMMYSSAVYPHPSATLYEASTYKLDLICKKLQLKPTDHLIEIGTGWGGMAIHAAKHYGCNVTTTTISKEQYDYAKAEVEAAGLADKITLLFDDYRELTGQYDKLVSIEMIEAVGHEYYESYFSSCSHLLKQDGLALIQAITISDQRFEKAKQEVDFIQRYIFPGGCLPSNAVIASNVSQYTDMQIVDLQDITQDYAQTLKDWREAFFNNINSVKAMGFDDAFIAMWDYYLCYCEGGFRERIIHTAQILLAKPQARHVNPAK